MEGLIPIKLLSADAICPKRATPESAGLDIFAIADCIVPSKGRGSIPTGISIAIPSGFYGQLKPRSSLAWNHHIDVGAGVIDSDYRGEIKVILFNHDIFDFQVKKGKAIAQLLILPVYMGGLFEVSDLSMTERGEGGFGSTNL